jgi:hypothetical protein
MTQIDDPLPCGHAPIHRCGVHDRRLGRRERVALHGMRAAVGPMDGPRIDQPLGH